VLIYEGALTEQLILFTNSHAASAGRSGAAVSGKQARWGSPEILITSLSLSEFFLNLTRKLKSPCLTWPGIVLEAY
jgi:hypothetical protein